MSPSLRPERSKERGTATGSVRLGFFQESTARFVPQGTGKTLQFSERGKKREITIRKATVLRQHLFISISVQQQLLWVMFPPSSSFTGETPKVPTYLLEV